MMMRPFLGSRRLGLLVRSQPVAPAASVDFCSICDGLGSSRLLQSRRLGGGLTLGGNGRFLDFAAGCSAAVAGCSGSWRPVPQSALRRALPTSRPLRPARPWQLPSRAGSRARRFQAWEQAACRRRPRPPTFPMSVGLGASVSAVTVASGAAGAGCSASTVFCGSG